MTLIIDEKEKYAKDKMFYAWKILNMDKTYNMVTSNRTII